MILAIRTIENKEINGNFFLNDLLDVKFSMGEFFDTGNTKMMVPIFENEIFGIILAFKQRN